MSTHAAHLQPPPAPADAREPLAAAAHEVSALGDGRRIHPPAPPAERLRPVTFYSIELDTPARDFWECLARLLSLLGALARRRAGSR